MLTAPPEIETQRGLYSNISSENYADNFRLTKVSKIKNEIADETEHYRLVLKKYKKARKAIYYATVCLGSLTTALSAGAIATPLTGVGIVVGKPLAAVAAFSGASSTGLTAINKKLERKGNKHTKIHALAVAKHDSINSYVLKSLDHIRVTDLEFQKVSSEIQKYRQLKETLRSKFAEKNNVNSPKLDPGTIRNEVRQKLRKKTVQCCSRFEVKLERNNTSFYLSLVKTDKALLSRGRYVTGSHYCHA